MGWQDRDYAKWTDEERTRFLASSATSLGSPLPPTTSCPRRRGGLIRPGAGAAILAAAFILALGRFPTSHPIIPSLRFAGPRASGAAQPTETINGPSTASLGSTLDLHGSAPASNGAVAIEGSYDGGRSWKTLATVGSANGSYSAQVPLEQSGVLQLRILFADGTQAVGSITVD